MGGVSVRMAKIAEAGTMIPGELRLRFIVLVTSISIAAAGTPAVGTVRAAHLPDLATPQGQSSITTTTADAAARWIEAMAKDIPRDTFDPLAIIRVVGKDRAALLEWVRNQTYWVPYRGALRGPTGVLMDRLGNSLDRSLLLAELLTLAGHTVRLAQGNLSDQAAREVLQRLRPVPANPVPVSAPDEAVVQRQAKQFGVDLQTARAGMQREQQAFAGMKKDLAGRVAAQTPFLVSQLGPRSATSDATAVSVAALRDHWWVQVRDNARWMDLDPMWPASGAVAGTVVAARTVAFDRPRGEIPLPSDQVHEVTLRVVVEQWKQGKVVEKTPLAHTFRPAESYGQPIVVQVAPMGWPKTSDILKQPDPAAALRTTLQKQTEWLPSITVGDRSIRQSSFTETGELNGKPGQPMAAAAAVASSIADAFGGGDEAPPGVLTAAWVECETRVPGRQPHRVRRDLFDLFNPRPRSQNAMADPALDEAKRDMRALGLATAIQFLAVAAKPSREYVASHMVAGVLLNREARVDMARRAAAGDIAGAISRAEGMKLTLNGQLLDLAYARFEWSAARQDVYLDAPNLLSYRTSLFQDASSRIGARQGFDVITNGIAIRPGASSNAFEVRVQQGTVDTNLEDLLMRRRTTGNAGALLAASNQQGWVTVRGASDPAWSRLALPADVRARIEDQLRLGYVVVAPGASAVAAAKGQMAWWRIDPKTGETLGFGSLGWGQGLAEYASVFFFSGLLIFAICMLVQVGPRQTSAQFNQNLLQCSCIGLGGAVAVLAAGTGEGLGVGLFILGQTGFACTMSFGTSPAAAGSAGSVSPDPPSPCAALVEPEPALSISTINWNLSQ